MRKPIKRIQEAQGRRLKRLVMPIEMHSGRILDWASPLPNQLEVRSGKLLVKGTDAAPSFEKWARDCDVVVIDRGTLNELRDAAFMHWNHAA